MRIKKKISIGELLIDQNTKFSKLTSQELYGKQ